MALAGLEMASLFVVFDTSYFQNRLVSSIHVMTALLDVFLMRLYAALSLAES